MCRYQKRGTNRSHGAIDSARVCVVPEILRVERGSWVGLRAGGRLATSKPLAAPRVTTNSIDAPFDRQIKTVFSILNRRCHIRKHSINAHLDAGSNDRFRSVLCLHRIRPIGVKVPGYTQQISHCGHCRPDECHQKHHNYRLSHPSPSPQPRCAVGSWRASC